MRNWRWFLLAGALLVGVPAFAESMSPDSIRYVRTDADGNNDGRSNTTTGAWTLAEANALARPGHTILIGSGDYGTTAINPATDGETLAPWNNLYSGRIVFSGKTSNAQACSLGGVSLRRANVTVKYVTVKQNYSITLGALSSYGAYNVYRDSIVGVHLRRGTGAFAAYGPQNCVVYACSLQTATTGTQGIFIGGDGETGWAAGGGVTVTSGGACPGPNSPSCPGDVVTRAPQFNAFRKNWVVLEKTRKGHRKFLIAGHAVQDTVDSNFIKVYFDSTGSSGSESGIGFELSRAYWTQLNDNKWQFEADGNHNEYWRSFAFRDSTYGTRFKRDTVYAGLNEAGQSGISTRRVPINIAIAQTGTKCCNPSSEAGAWDTQWDSCRFVMTGGFADKAEIKQVYILNSEIVSVAGIPIDFGTSKVTASVVRGNTIYSRNGNRSVVINTAVANGQLSMVDNIIACDLLAPMTNACSSGGAGGAAFFHADIGSGLLARNLWWVRSSATGTGAALRDTVIKWSWKGFYKPDATDASCSSGQSWYNRNDTGSRFGSPVFSDSSFTTAFNGTPPQFGLADLMSGTVKGYAGAKAPADNIPPGYVPLTVTAWGPEITKRFDFIESGDDSTFGVADSVFVCERADSSRIDNTNWRNYILFGFKCSGGWGFSRTVICSQTDSGNVPSHPTDPWVGCGSDALLPGNRIGYLRSVNKDEAGNLTFSGTVDLIWTTTP